MSAKEERKYVKLYHEELRLDTKKISDYENEELSNSICFGIQKLCSHLSI